MATTAWTRSISRGAHQAREEREVKRYYRQEARCYKCGKKRHFARDCKSSQAKGNIVTFTNNDSEEEWDFQASFIIEESNQANDVEVATSHTDELKQDSAPAIMSNKSISY